MKIKDELGTRKSTEVIKYLLAWKPPLGSDPNLPGNDGRTPLHRAAFHGMLAAVQMLLEAGSDPRIKDNQGELPCAEP